MLGAETGLNCVAFGIMRGCSYWYESDLIIYAKYADSQVRDGEELPLCTELWR